MKFDEELLAASYHGDYVRATAAVGNGANVNSTSATGQTSLHFACVSDIALARFLIDRGADVNAKTDLGATPLHWASHDGNTEIVRLLLENAANTTAIDLDGNTPRQWAIDNGHTQVASLLENAAHDISRNINDNVTSESHATAVQDRRKKGFLPDR